MKIPNALSPEYHYNSANADGSRVLLYDKTVSPNQSSMYDTATGALLLRLGPSESLPHYLADDNPAWVANNKLLYGRRKSSLGKIVPASNTLQSLPLPELRQLDPSKDFRGIWSFAKRIDKQRPMLHIRGADYRSSLCQQFDLASGTLKTIDFGEEETIHELQQVGDWAFALFSNPPRWKCFQKSSWGPSQLTSNDYPGHAVWYGRGDEILCLHVVPGFVQRSVFSKTASKLLTTIWKSPNGSRSDEKAQHPWVLGDGEAFGCTGSLASSEGSALFVIDPQTGKRERIKMWGPLREPLSPTAFHTPQGPVVSVRVKTATEQYQELIPIGDFVGKPPAPVDPCEEERALLDKNMVINDRLAGEISVMAGELAVLKQKLKHIRTIVEG